MTYSSIGIFYFIQSRLIKITEELLIAVISDMFLRVRQFKLSESRAQSEVYETIIAEVSDHKSILFLGKLIIVFLHHVNKQLIDACFLIMVTSS